MRVLFPNFLHMSLLLLNVLHIRVLLYHVLHMHIQLLHVRHMRVLLPLVLHMLFILLHALHMHVLYTCMSCLCVFFPCMPCTCMCSFLACLLRDILSLDTSHPGSLPYLHPVLLLANFAFLVTFSQACRTFRYISLMKPPLRDLYGK